jgi:hypothetical protein
MALELFNPSFAVLAAIACPAAYLITGNRSVYPTQRMSESKVSSVRVAEGVEIGAAEQNFTHSYSKWLQKAINLFKKKPKAGNAEAEGNIKESAVENAERSAEKNPPPH